MMDAAKVLRGPKCRAELRPMAALASLFYSAGESDRIERKKPPRRRFPNVLAKPTGAVQIDRSGAKKSLGAVVAFRIQVI